jgi:hypothetical protein
MIVLMINKEATPATRTYKKTEGKAKKAMTGASTAVTRIDSNVLLIFWLRSLFAASSTAAVAFSAAASSAVGARGVRRSLGPESATGTCVD